MNINEGRLEFLSTPLVMSYKLKIIRIREINLNLINYFHKVYEFKIYILQLLNYEVYFFPFTFMLE
jgi:hypothetical protein